MSIGDRIRRFGTLIDVYRRREDAQARKLRDAELLASRERAQLEKIEGIQSEYRDGLVDAGRAGTTAQRLKNWHRFVRNLDDVQAEQIARAARASGARDAERAAWIAQHRRVGGFEALSERLETERDAQTRRVEQRHMDELGGARHVRSKAEEDGR